MNFLSPDTDPFLDPHILHPIFQPCELSTYLRISYPVNFLSPDTDPFLVPHILHPIFQPCELSKVKQLNTSLNGVVNTNIDFDVYTRELDVKHRGTQ